VATREDQQTVRPASRKQTSSPAQAGDKPGRWRRRKREGIGDVAGRRGGAWATTWLAHGAARSAADINKAQRGWARCATACERAAGGKRMALYPSYHNISGATWRRQRA